MEVQVDEEEGYDEGRSVKEMVGADRKSIKLFIKSMFVP